MRRDARRRRDRPLPEHEAAAVRAQGARRAARNPRAARRRGLDGRRLHGRRRNNALGRRRAPRHRARLPGARHGRRAGLLASASEHGYHRGQRLCGYPVQLLQSVLRMASGHRVLHEERRRHLSGGARKLTVLGRVLVGHRAGALGARREAANSRRGGRAHGADGRALSGRRDRIPRQASRRDRRRHPAASGRGLALGVLEAPATRLVRFPGARGGRGGQDGGRRGP